MSIGLADVEWVKEEGFTPYPDALALMEARVAAIREGRAKERIWLVEHEPLYTSGTSAKMTDLLDPNRFPVFNAGRGGQFTYHGPGQRVGYLMLDLDRRCRDIRCFVSSLEQWLIDTLKAFDVHGRAIEGRVGIWVDTPQGEAKIGAIGVRVRKWVSFHGFAVNVEPELEHFAGIVPCGISEYGVTSLKALGKPVTMTDFDTELKRTFPAFLEKLDAVSCHRD